MGVKERKSKGKRERGSERARESLIFSIWFPRSLALPPIRSAR
jgi:hypothetical protein